MNPDRESATAAHEHIEGDWSVDSVALALLFLTPFVSPLRQRLNSDAVNRAEANGAIPLVARLKEILGRERA